MAQLMLSEGQSVSRVQEQLGFTSYAYFFKFFKKMTGISPSHYRKTSLIKLSFDEVTTYSAIHCAISFSYGNIVVSIFLNCCYSNPLLLIYYIPYNHLSLGPDKLHE